MPEKVLELSSLAADTQSHDQLRTWALPQGEVGRMRTTNTHLCASLEDSDHHRTTSRSCGNKGSEITSSLLVL